MIVTRAMNPIPSDMRRLATGLPAIDPWNHGLLLATRPSAGSTRAEPQNSCYDELPLEQLGYDLLGCSFRSPLVSAHNQVRLLRRLVSHLKARHRFG
jgi:hypothetical protein